MPDMSFPEPLAALPKEPRDLPKEAENLPVPEKRLLSETTLNADFIKESNSPLLFDSQGESEAKKQKEDGIPDQANQSSETERTNSVRTLLSWHAPDRIHHRKGRAYYINIILIILILEVLLFLFHQFTLMILLVTLGFLSFSLAIMPPNIIRYRISNQGISLDESFFLWQELYDFYFTIREGENVLHIRTVDYYPGEVVLHLGELHKDQLISLLLPYLPYRESVRKTFMEKSGDWLSRTFPLDKLPSKSSGL